MEIKKEGLVEIIDDIVKALRLLTGVYGKIVIRELRVLGSLNYESINQIAELQKLSRSKIRERLVDLEAYGLVVKKEVQPVVYILDNQRYEDLIVRVKRLSASLNLVFQQDIPKQDYEIVRQLIDALRLLLGRSMDIINTLRERKCFIGSNDSMTDSAISNVVGLSKSAVTRNAVLLEKYKILIRTKTKHKIENQLCLPEFFNLRHFIEELESVIDTYLITDPYIAKYYRVTLDENGVPKRIRLPSKTMKKKR